MNRRHTIPTADRPDFTDALDIDLGQELEEDEQDLEAEEAVQENETGFPAGSVAERMQEIEAAADKQPKPVAAPSKRQPLPTDTFQVLTWPSPGTGNAMGKLARKLGQSNMPLPEQMDRVQLVSAGVNIAQAVLYGILKPLSQNCPEQPYLTPDEFADRFMQSHEHDAPRRLQAVFSFLSWPQGDAIHHEIPSPVPASYILALVDRMQVTPACLAILVQELDAAKPATQDVAFQLLKRDPSAFKGKTAAPALPELIRAIGQDWDTETLLLFVQLLQCIPAKPSAALLQALRKLQRCGSHTLSEKAVEAEFALFLEPVL